MKTYRSLQLALAAGLGLSAVSCMVETPAVTTTVETYRPGYYTRTIPGRYETRMVRGNRYYYYDNVYYRPQGEGYVVVESPYGTTMATRSGYVRTLPSGYRVVDRGGHRYYLSGSDYYRSEGDGYMIVRDPF